MNGVWAVLALLVVIGAVVIWARIDARDDAETESRAAAGEALTRGLEEREAIAREVGKLSDRDVWDELTGGGRHD